MAPSVQDQFYIRFKNKPTHECHTSLTFIEFEGQWARVYKEANLMGVDFISEASWEKGWFERNPEIYEMIKTNDKVIAMKIIHHKNTSIAFLAKEIKNGNLISIVEDKILLTKPQE